MKNHLLFGLILLFISGCSDNVKTQKIINDFKAKNIIKELKTQKWEKMVDAAHSKLGKYDVEDIDYFKKNIIPYMNAEKLNEEKYGGAVHFTVTLRNNKNYCLAIGPGFWQVYDKKEFKYAQPYKMDKDFYDKDHFGDLVNINIIRGRMIKNQPFDFTQVPNILENETKDNLRKVFSSLNSSSPLNMRRLSIIFNKPEFPYNFQSNYNNNPKFRKYIFNISKNLKGKKNFTYKELLEVYYSLNYKFISKKQKK